MLFQTPDSASTQHTRQQSKMPDLGYLMRIRWNCTGTRTTESPHRLPMEAQYNVDCHCCHSLSDIQYPAQFETFGIELPTAGNSQYQTLAQQKRFDIRLQSLRSNP